MDRGRDAQQGTSLVDFGADNTPITNIGGGIAECSIQQHQHHDQGLDHVLDNRAAAGFRWPW